MNNTELFEDSPNGYRITCDQPKGNTEVAIEYYLTMLEKFTREIYPVEFGVTNYGLGRLLFEDRVNSPNDEEKAKRIENALFYFSQALETPFNRRDYPMMYALICVYISRLFRDRSLLISHRNFLHDRSTPSESLQYGIDQGAEALPLYSANRAFPVENSICLLELGYLTVLLLDLPEHCEDNSLREQAVGYLERALAIAAEVQESVTYKQQNGKATKWHPGDPKTFPKHVRHLLDNFNFAYLEGCAYYLLGRVEESWNFNAADYSEDDKAYHRRQAFDHLNLSVKPKYLTQECELWGDAHHRTALLIIKFPTLVDDEYDVDERGIPYSDLYLEIATSHLILGLRCKTLKKQVRMDCNFHLAQTYITKLQFIIDRVPYGESVTKAIVNSDGLDIINSIEENLKEALKRVTAANSQSVQDAYIYYYSSLKLAEYRMLQAACLPELTPEEREEHLRDAVEFVVDACLARTLPNNMDLHYVSNVQLAQMLAAVKRGNAACKSYAKTLMVLSVIVNRAVFNEIYFEGKLLEDIEKHTSQAIFNSNKEIDWVKLHLGPTVLHERVAAGYASWSFEDITSSKHKDKIALITNDGDHSSTTDGFKKVTKATPPKSVPPLQLSTANLKKVYITGEDIPDHLVAPVQKEADMEFPPPEGPVPLYALGHTPAMRQNSIDTIIQDVVGPSVAGEESRWPNSPYISRLRSRVPPLAEMKEIDKYNRAAFSLPKGKIAYLMPVHSPVKSAVQNNKALDNKANKPKKGLNAISEGKNEDDQSRVSDLDDRSHKDEKMHEEDYDSDDHGENVSGLESSASARIMRSVKDHWNGNKDKYSDSGEEKEDEPPVETRPRSRKIKPAAKPPPGKKMEKVNVFKWLLGGNKKAAPPSGEQPSPKPASRPFFMLPLFSARKKKASMKAKATSDAKEKKKKLTSLSDEIGFWASRQAFYTFMVLSRMSRMELTLRSKRLKLLQGERACTVFYKTKPKYLAILFQLRSKLNKASENLIVTPSSLKEISQLSSDDLQILFTSHAKIAARLDDLEHFFYFKMSKVDYFIPYIGVSPSFSRDLNSYDESLLNAELLIANIAVERNLAIMKENKKQGLAPRITPTKNNIHSYDSVSSAAKSKSTHSHVRMNSSYPKPLIGSDVRLSNVEQKQAEEEREEIHAGKMTYSLSQNLDGFGYLLNGQQGAKDFLLQSLANNECMMIWHLPTIPSQHLMVVLIWRENSQSLHSHYSSHLAYESRLEEEEEKKQDKYKKKEKQQSKKKSSAKGIVMEVAKSDLDASHTLQHMQRYLDALHAKPAPMRTALATDALRSLSCALSISELLLMIPSSVQSLVICCSPLMRMIPWHLLLYEDTSISSPTTASNLHSTHSNDSNNGVNVRHLMETYKVRLGPSLSLFELSNTAAHKLRQSVGLHRMCAIDGDDRDKKHIDTHSKASTAGVRGADLEVSCVTTTWSADPDDSHVLQDEAASSAHLETTYFGEERLDRYRKFKRQLGNLRGDDEVSGNNVENAMKSLAGKGNSLGKSKETYSGKHKKASDNKSDEESDKESQEQDDEEAQEELKQISEEQKYNVQSLTACRVLHIAANKSPLDGKLTDRQRTKLEAGVFLPKDNDAFMKYDAKTKRQPASAFTAADFVKKIYVRNCALCVLSRFGLTDDVTQVNSLSIDSNWEFVEAMHVSGACSVLVPLWYQNSHGMSTLADLLFLIRFYSILPSKSRERLSIVETVRRTQLWLRDVSANDAIAFIAKAPIPQKARDTIIEEMESYVQASLSPMKTKMKGDASVVSKTTASNDLTHFTSPSQPNLNKMNEEEEVGKGGNREGGERKFFSHFLLWGAYTVTGYGGGVHHPDLTEEHEDEEGFGDGLWNDEELNNIIFETSVLRMEGKIKEAVELENYIRHLRLERVKTRYDAMKKAGWKAGRTFMDTVDYLDKAFLDQDSDEVSSVSSDDSDGSDEGEGKVKSKKKKEKSGKLTGPNGEVLDTSSSLLSNEADGTTGDPQSQSSKQRFRPLELDKRNQDVQYEAWKAKVGTLSMDVKQVSFKKHGKVSRNVKSTKQPTPKKPDNYEYNLLKAMEPVPVDEDSGNSDEDERKNKKKKKGKESIWGEVFGGVRSYGEIAKMLADQAEEIQPPPLSAVKNDDCIVM